jgi:2-isopropylmalate synthase
MSLLGLEQNEDHAKAVASGLKNLRMGDLLEIPLDDRLEQKIIDSEQTMESKEKTKSGR